MGWWCVTYSVQVDVYPAVRGLLAPQRAPDNSLANSLFAHAEDIGGLLERHPTGWLHRHPLGCLPLIGGILPLRAPFLPVRRRPRASEEAYYGRGWMQATSSWLSCTSCASAGSCARSGPPSRPSPGPLSLPSRRLPTVESFTEVFDWLGWYRLEPTL